MLEVRARPCSKSQRGHSVTRCGNIPRWYRADSFCCFPGRAHRQGEAFPRGQGKSMRLGFARLLRPTYAGANVGTPDSAPRQAERFDLYNFGHLRRDHTFVDDMWRELFAFYLYCRMAARRKGRGHRLRCVCAISETSSPSSFSRWFGSAEIRIMLMRQEDVYQTYACVDKRRTLGEFSRASQSKRAYKGLGLSLLLFSNG